MNGHGDRFGREVPTASKTLISTRGKQQFSRPNAIQLRVPSEYRSRMHCNSSTGITFLAQFLHLNIYLPTPKSIFNVFLSGTSTSFPSVYRPTLAPSTPLPSKKTTFRFQLSGIPSPKWMTVLKKKLRYHIVLLQSVKFSE